MSINVSLKFQLGLDMNRKHVIDDKEVLTWSSYSQFFLVITRKPHLIGHSHVQHFKLFWIKSFIVVTGLWGFEASHLFGTLATMNANCPQYLTVFMMAMCISCLSMFSHSGKINEFRENP